MRSVRCAVVFGIWIGCAVPAWSQPAQHPEQATVFIEVNVETRDPGTNAPRLNKVGEGSGFIIHRGGWVVTAAHVTKVELPAGSRLALFGSVRSRHATKFPLEIPPISVTNSDITLLRFPPGLGVDYPYLCVLRHPQLQHGAPLVALGFPLGFDISVRPGPLTSLAGPNSLLQTNMGLARGMSGGPVIDDKRQVVGVIHGGVEGQSSFDFFTPVNLALPLFDVPPASYVGESCPASTGPIATASTVERSYQVDETYDEHPGLSPTSKEYRIVQKADPGHVIVDARLVRQSDTRVSDLTVTVAPDRKSVELKFKLMAGPLFDRWRGWLHGQLILTMRREG
jgi:S1-C subfamily serine protease